MWSKQRLNNALTGVAAGLIMPVLAFFIFFMFTRNGLPLDQYFQKMLAADNLTEVMSVSAFTNIIVFLLFNRFDMLRASKGVVGITLIWAFAVFGIKLF